MSNNRSPFSAKDKGFYIALFVCAVAVGIGAWAMLSFRNTDTLLPAEEPIVSAEVFYPKTAAPIPSAASEPMTVPSSKPAVNPNLKPAAFMWPVSGDVLVPYSASALAYNATMADWRIHPGLDIKSDIGTGVSAITDGKVIAVEKGTMAGTTVKIEHTGGLVSIYSNLADNVKLAVGSKVEMGGLIGSVGQTSVAEAGLDPHLHLEMTLNGNFVNPLDYLPA
jgi:murein DD-endopeptidase MepM/ murein hydrolase activator NlpD